MPGRDLAKSPVFWIPPALAVLTLIIVLILGYRSMNLEDVHAALDKLQKAHQHEDTWWEDVRARLERIEAKLGAGR